ncbi:MAG TPA: multidrug effflux MFS transporter [Chthoniobacteraceae bacterium]|nr:multidrug effflux MFS transporter [Chthoniobacteraceae bacterium]
MTSAREANPIRGLLLFFLAALTAFGPLSIDMYLPAFPQITADLHAREGAVEMTLGIFLLSMGVCQVLYGPVSDRFGRRLPLMVGCSLFILGSLWCTFASSVHELMAARFLQGFGGAAGVVIARACVRDTLNETQAARAFSQLMLVMGIAPILAPWVGGQVLLHGTWHHIFLVMGLFGLFCLAGAIWVLPETLPVERRVKGGLGIALGNFWLLLRDRTYLGYITAGGFNSGILFSYIAGSPFVLIQLHKVPAQQYAYFFGANALGIMGAAQLNRALLRQWTPDRLLRASLLASALFGAGLVFCGVTGRGGLWLLLAFLFLSLSCVGIAFPNLAATALSRHGRRAGSAAALLGAAQFLVGGCFGLLVGWFNNGTALPMTGLMAASGLAGWIALRLLVPDPRRG